MAAVAALAASGCGTPARTTAPKSATPEASSSRSLELEITRREEKDDTPNPGSGPGDPRLAKALLARFQDAQERPGLPGAVVALPVTDLESLFIPLRQHSTAFLEREECHKWTIGLWFEVLQRYNTPGVQMAVTTLSERDSVAGLQERPEAAVFSEAIITGPRAMLDRLGDPTLPAACRHLSDAAVGTGSIQPLAVPPLGERSWAYRVTGSGEVPIWHWVAVIQTSRYVLEIRIPNQQPSPRVDPAVLLPHIAQEAYTKAEAAYR
ncbi:hypothetical protein [Nonomuraea sp. NPDC050310]|uniref:hypothetical protein n=1 Tax=Nonomuraea sp. NPDC050310 TaxID=3154935 RepID=UPI0033C79B2D